MFYCHAYLKLGKTQGHDQTMVVSEMGVQSLGVLCTAGIQGTKPGKFSDALHYSKK